MSADLANNKQTLAVVCYSPLPLVVTLTEVAAILRCDETAVRVNHAQWSAKQAFPKPLPGMRPLKWSGPQVEMWIRNPAKEKVDPEDVSQWDGLFPDTYQRKAA